MHVWVNEVEKFINRLQKSSSLSQASAVDR